MEATNQDRNDRYRSDRPSPCDHPGCSTSTRERKPYCTEHVREHPYVTDLLARLSAIERELAAVERRGTRAVDIDGVLATEVLRELSLHGDRTIRRLARDLALPTKVLDAYVRALAKAGRVTTGHTNRNREMVQLSESDREEAA